MLYLTLFIILYGALCEDIEQDHLNMGKNLLDMMKTKDEHYMSNIKHETGFDRLANKLLYTSGTIRSNDDSINKLINIMLGGTIFEQFDTETKNTIFRALDELKLQIITDRGTNIKYFGINYNGNDGKMYIFLMALWKSHEIDNAIGYEKCVINTEFTPSKSYVVITNTNENFFRSSTEQHIEYIPTGIKDYHTQSIMQINQQILDSMLNR